MALFSITAKATGWKAIISSLRCVGEAASFVITNEGLEFYCMDASHISVISMKWRKENMEELTLDVENKTVGFRTDDLDKIFKRFDASDEIDYLVSADQLVIKQRTQNLKLLAGMSFV